MVTPQFLQFPSPDYLQGKEDGYRAAEDFFLEELAKFLKEQKTAVKNNRYWRQHGEITMGYTTTVRTLTKEEAQAFIKKYSGEWVEIN